MFPAGLSSLLAASANGPLPGLARKLIHEGGIRQPLLDAMAEEGLKMIKVAVGQMVYVETLTKYYVGRVLECEPTELVLDEAAWIDDTGRLNTFLERGTADGLSVEPYPDPVRIPAHMITVVTTWNHKPFRKVI
jgi:hypothetical protein